MPSVSMIDIDGFGEFSESVDAITYAGWSS